MAGGNVHGARDCEGSVMRFSGMRCQGHAGVQLRDFGFGWGIDWRDCEMSGWGERLAGFVLCMSAIGVRIPAGHRYHGQKAACHHGPSCVSSWALSLLIPAESTGLCTTRHRPCSRGIDARLGAEEGPSSWLHSPRYPVKKQNPVSLSRLLCGVG
jgi:hypothetical protein